jgi:predicted nicotinamide N-methyase
MRTTSQTVISDYNDAALVANIAHNIAVNCIGLPGRTLAVGQTWGYDPSALLDAHDGSASGYDLVLLADVVFNHSQHAALLATCEAVLAPGGQVLCFYSHHRPWLVEADERLFAVAEGRGWTCERIWKDEKAGVRRPALRTQASSCVWVGRLSRGRRRSGGERHCTWLAAASLVLVTPRDPRGAGPDAWWW